MSSKEKHAQYLQNPDTNHVQLVHADDLEAHHAKGWKQPTSTKPNGSPYNHEDDLEGQDAAAEGAKKAAVVKEKKDAEKQKARDEAAKAAEKAHKDVPEHVDMTVAVVKSKK